METSFSHIARHPLQYLGSKLLQFRFALAYRCNSLAIGLLQRSRSLITGRFYAFETESYVADLTGLHKKIDQELKRQRKEYKCLRYSFGYPYQALNTLGVFGARSTEDRWATYDLSKYITTEQTILDIGCNCGFMSLYAVYRTGCKADAIDINPFMLNIGRHCAEMLRVDDHIRFICSDFAMYQEERQYGVVFSFAAHHTEDKRHRPDLPAYFERIHRLLLPGGLLIFESHGYDANNPEFQQRIRSMGDLFDIQEHRLLFGGNRDLFYFRRLESRQRESKLNVAGGPPHMESAVTPVRTNTSST